MNTLAVVKQVQRLYLTIKQFQPRQLRYNIQRRLLPQPYRATKIGGDVSLNTTFSLAAMSMQSPRLSFIDTRQRFVFLHRAANFSLDAIDWRGQGQSKLWRYNLHYFDYLLADDIDLATKQALISDWVASNIIGVEDAWEPYTCSLRIVNWIKFFVLLKRSGLQPEPLWLQSLYTQCDWLNQNMEYHIDANHLFKNLVALTYARAFFNGDLIGAWGKHERELLQQLGLQFMPDGGHYECTPSYHALMLRDCFELLALYKENTQLVNTELEHVLLDVCKRAYVCYKNLLMLDDKLLLWNDSAFDSAPTAEFMGAWARHFGLVAAVKSAEYRYLTDFGLMSLVRAQDQLCFDVGNVGPGHQPGHTHCDALNFELMLAGQRFIVDSGTDDYSQPSRAYLRSTRAHNCLQINAVEQHQIWGEFRVAARAKVTDASRYVVSEACDRMQASLLHYHGNKHAPKQQRYIEIAKNAQGFQRVLVCDQLTVAGRIKKPVEQHLASYLHLAPGFKPELIAGRAVVQFDAATLITIHAEPACRLTVKPTEYYSEFGLREEKYSLCFESQQVLPAQLKIMIEIERNAATA